jgi:hypothetical protein
MPASRQRLYKVNAVVSSASLSNDMVPKHNELTFTPVLPNRRYSMATSLINLDEDDCNSGWTNRFVNNWGLSDRHGSHPCSDYGQIQTNTAQLAAELYVSGASGFVPTINTLDLMTNIS